MPLPLALRLHPPGASLPEGQPLQAVGGTQAVLVLGSNEVGVDVALPELSLAEVRWAVDQLLRKLRGVVRFEAVTIGAAGEIADDTVATLALDLHHGLKGQVSVLDRPAVSRIVEEIGPLEDRYRAWVNEGPSTRTSVAIAGEVQSWAAGRDDVEVEVLAEDELKQHGLELLLAVGRAATVSPPRLVIARYRPAEPNPLMLLGKGITFDTGGINTKPYESYVSMMKNDMAGAALAYSLFTGLVEQGHDQPLLLVIPTCENSVGSHSMRPGDVFKSYAGPTVRVDHTDAEGRLVLADGLAYAERKHQPKEVLCFATLTTSALISYGPFATPVHFATDSWEQRLRAASAATGEDMDFFAQRLWHFEANRDKEADLRNTASLSGDAGRSAGSRNAGHFLLHFTDRPLMHFDIFASGWNWSGEAPGCGYGATGAPLRTLFRALRG